jgi:hypothetical protein
MGFLHLTPACRHAMRDDALIRIASQSLQEQSLQDTIKKTYEAVKLHNILSDIRNARALI